VGVILPLAVMARLHLALLGGFEARLASGRQLRLPKTKAKALLAFLALHPRQMFARDKLAALLWPEFRDEDARHSLRQTLFTLRKSVRPLDLAVDDDSLTLRPSFVAVDVAIFERLVAKGTPAALAEATPLYRGDLLEGLRVSEPPFEDWLVGERQRLRELALEVLRKLLAHETEAGRTADAIRTATRLLALDPLQEVAHRLLMRLYAADGRRAQALRQYHACARTLQRELGVRPEPQTEEIYQDLFVRQIRPLGARSRSETPLVGRELEVATLRQALARASTGIGQVVTIRGEAGVGKTRVAEELATEARRRGWRVLVGRAYETEQVFPFSPWLDALRPTVVTEARKAVETMPPIFRREMTRLFPEIEEPECAQRVEAEGHAHLFEAVAHLLGRLSAGRPLLLVLEDIHWADDMSLRLLAFVAHRLNDERQLLVASARDEELADRSGLRQLIAALDRDRHHVGLELVPLSRERTAILARSLVGAAPASLPMELEERVWTASQGNPFVTVEMMREIRQGRPQGGTSLAALPGRVSEVIAARFDRLGEREGMLMAVAAVIGREFEPALLQLATGLDADEVASGVEALVRRRVFAMRSDRLDFVHDRVRTVALSRLLPPRRSLIHARVARAIEGVYAGDLAGHAGSLAMHFREGEVWGKALAYLPVAGRLAATRLAHKQAAHCFEQALEAISHLPESRNTTEQAIDIRFDLRNALGMLGEQERGLEHLREAERLSKELGDRRRLGLALIYISQALWHIGRLVEAHARAQEARAIGEALGDGVLTATADKYLGQACFSLGEYHEASERLKAAVHSTKTDSSAGLPGPGNYYPAESAWGWLAWALGERGEFDEGIAAGREGTRLAQASGHPVSLCMVSVGLAELYCIKGESSLAWELMESALELVRRYELRNMAFTVTRTLGSAYVLAGRFREGVGLLERALVIMESLGQGRPHTAHCLEQLGRASLREGRLDDAEALGERAVARARAQGERGFAAHALHLLADVLGHAERLNVEAAEAYYGEALATATDLGMHPLTARCHRGLGNLYQLAGRQSHARKHSAIATKMGHELNLRDF
jgi:DNA-binding SARP family transcriptional activator